MPPSGDQDASLCFAAAQNPYIVIDPTKRVIRSLGGGTVERRWMPAERFDAPCMHRLIGDAAVTRPTGRDAATWPRRSAFPRRVDNMGDGTVFAPTSPSAAF